MSLCMCCTRTAARRGQAEFVAHAHAHRCPVHPHVSVIGATEPCRNADPNRLYGFDVTYVTHDGRELSCHFVTTSEKTARRKTMFKKHIRTVTEVRPLTEAAYVKAFGRGRM